MLVETAALRLGSTVAKAAGQLWLRSKQREQERSLSMDELIRVRVPGIRLQREVSQQFEQIANAVFDRLEPHLQHAFQRLGEGGCEAVIDAVSDTFTRADLSDEALLAANAHPAQLIRDITGSVRAPVGLNEAEARLYERLFAECVEYYVASCVACRSSRSGQRLNCWPGQPRWVARLRESWSDFRIARCSRRTARTRTPPSGVRTWNWSAGTWTRWRCFGVRPTRGPHPAYHFRPRTSVCGPRAT